jgi:transposase
MFSTQLFDLVLGFGDSWHVVDVKVNFKNEEVDVFIEYKDKKGSCPELGNLYPIYDRRAERRWRHLDTMQYKTFINCRVPRIKTDKGVKTIEVPWAGSFERHSYLFERLTIDVLQATKNQTATAKLLRVGFNVINRVIHLSTKRGLERRDKTLTLANYSIDEKSFRKGHSYVSVLSSPVAGVVIDVVENRTKEAVKKLISQGIPDFDKVETVSMDMWPAYLNTIKEKIPNANIIHDRFHLVKYLNDGLDKVRKREVKEHEELRNTKYVLLKNQANLTDKQYIKFKSIQDANYEVSRAWRIKEDFRSIFGSKDMAEAVGLFIKWGSSVIHSRIAEMFKVAKMFNKHLEGVCNALVSKFSNAMAERLNGKIQEVKSTARGYKKFDNFRSAILFFHGGLNLYPHK